MSGSPPLSGEAHAATVLVAEDEDSVRAMVAAVLRRQGFEPVLCVDGQEAIERLESGLEVDALLADIRMPRLGGLELVARLRRDPRWRDLPVIAMSAFNDELQEREILAAGASAFLPKPFTIQSLTQVLHDLLGTGEPRA